MAGQTIGLQLTLRPNRGNAMGNRGTSQGDVVRHVAAAGFPV